MIRSKYGELDDGWMGYQNNNFQVQYNYFSFILLTHSKQHYLFSNDFCYFNSNLNRKNQLFI